MPYNTGSDFVYKDNFSVSVAEYEDATGVCDDAGNKMFKNTNTNGRFHSDWCSMIYSRLLLASKLLKDDGILFISIDDNEVENLTKIGKEIFGESNYINALKWKRKNNLHFYQNILLLSWSMFLYLQKTVKVWENYQLRV